MALVIDLKPNEKVIIGSSTIINDKQRTRLRIEGDAPILREKDTMTAEDATTPSKKLYLTIQEMYLAHADQALNSLGEYFASLDQIRDMAPHISNFLNDISIHVLQGTYYKALKLVHDLINFETEGTQPEDTHTSGQNQFNQMHMEAQLLSQSSEQLKELHDNWDDIPANEREATVSYNRKLWMVFFDGINDPSGKKTEMQKSNADQRFNIQANILNLYNYIYKLSKSLIEHNDRKALKILIAINDETTKALRRN